MDGGEVNLLDLVTGDVVRTYLVAIGIVLLDFLRRGSSIQTLHSNAEQVLAVDGLSVRCHLLHPSLMST